jgi:hypothetical protein
MEIAFVAYLNGGMHWPSTCHNKLYVAMEDYPRTIIEFPRLCAENGIGISLTAGSKTWPAVNSFSN